MNWQNALVQTSALRTERTLVLFAFKGPVDEADQIDNGCQNTDQNSQRYGNQFDL